MNDKPYTAIFSNFQNGLNLLTHNSLGRYSMETTSSGDGGQRIKSVLTVRNVEKADEDEYACAMENPFGRDVGRVRLVVQGKNNILISVSALGKLYSSVQIKNTLRSHFDFPYRSR